MQMKQQQSNGPAGHQAPPKPPSQHHPLRVFLAALFSVLVGVLGNLVAEWIQGQLFGSIFSWQRLVVIVIALIVGLAMGFFIERVHIVYAVLIAFVGVALIFFLLKSVRYECPYQRPNPVDTMISMIHAEAEAVKTEDIEIIRQIFGPQAVIKDAQSGAIWTDPVVRYRTLFENTAFVDLVHYEIQPAGPGVLTDAAWFTSGSKGSFMATNGAGGKFDNPPGRDHWTFRKDRFGCWVITDFSFNDERPFP